MRRHSYYRNIYKKTHGPIPKDENGRSYEIHHIDNNHENDDITNLKAVSIQEHYDIHKSQKDWAACKAISMRMKLSPEEMARISRESNLRRVVNGTHPTKKMIEDGTHIFLNKEWQKENSRRIMEGGNHSVQQKWSCETCGKSGTNAVNYSRYHGNNCGQIRKKRVWINKDGKTLMIYSDEVLKYEDWQLGRIVVKQKNRKHAVSRCPHCDKEGGVGSMKRHHFDNCHMKSL